MLNRVYQPIAKQEVYPVLGFIDNTYFKSLSDKNTSIEDIYDYTRVYENRKESVSNLSLAYIEYLNKELFRILVNIDLGDCKNLVSSQERDYIKTKFKAEVLSPSLDYIPQDNLCYEIIPVNNDKFLVVISKGFINYVTSTKENYKEFLLSCLRAFDRFNCSTSAINKLYVNLLLNDKYLDLVKLKID